MNLRTTNLVVRAWLGFSLAVLTFGGIAAQTSDFRVGSVSLHIKAQPIAAALNEWSRQSGIQVLFYSDVADGLKEAPPLIGSFTSDEALLRLLSKTGLTYSYINERTVAIHRELSKAPDRKTANKEAERPFMRLANNEEISEELPNQAIAQARSEEGHGQERSAAEVPNAKKIVLEEILVTATRREKRLQDVPMSIAVIGNEDIEKRGLIGMEDYLRAVPGVSEIEMGARTNAIIVRGITTGPEFTTPGVGFYFDETVIGGATGDGGLDVRPVDIERIEVLRGPQVTLYGAGSFSGTVRVIPAKPKLDDFGGKLTVSYSDTSGFGSDNSMVQGVVNIPLVEDRLALRAVGYRYDDSGFYRNIAARDPATISFAQRSGLTSFLGGHVEDDVGRTLTTGGRLAALWQPTDKLNLSMNFLTQTIEQDGIPQATVGEYEQARFPVDPRIRVRDQVGEASDIKIDLLNFALNYDFGWATLTSVGSWISGDLVAATSEAVSRGRGSGTLGTTLESESYGGEVRLASQLEGRFQFLGGAFYVDGEATGRLLNHWPGPASTNLRGTDPQYNIINKGPNYQRGVFGEVSYDLTENLTATVGGRYFEGRSINHNFQEGGLVGVPLGSGVWRDSENSANNDGYKGDLSYKPTKDSLLYASFSQGFRLGTRLASPQLPSGLCDTDNDGLIDGTNVSMESTKTINSDYLDSYEVGGKFTLLDQRLTVNTAVYHMDWSGLPVRTFAGTCGLIYIANIGEATSDGAEFQASLLVGQGLRLDLGAGYSKAEITTDVPLQGWKEGDRLPAAPKWNANLAAQYDFDVAGRRAFVRADSMYAGKFYRGIGELPGTEAGDYIKVDMRAGVTINQLSAELFVRNLTNEDAFVWRTFDASVSKPFEGYRPRPRTVGIQLSYNFE